MKLSLSLVTVAFVTVATAQPITPFFTQELALQPTDLSHQPSSTDLINGFGESQLPGALNDLFINESFNNGFTEVPGDGDGVIDIDNDIASVLMDSLSDCLPLTAVRSDGFLPGFAGGNGGVFVDGQLNGNLDGILRDFARVSLSVRYSFANPTDVEMIRVIGGNTNNADGRTFHHYDVWASTDGLGDFGTFFLVAEGVLTGNFGDVNTTFSGAMTEVWDFDSQILVAGATDIRLVFYNVTNIDGRLQDQWQGNANEDAAYQAACPTVEPEDVDGFRKAFVGSIIREIDMFAPGVETPFGDIDYDEDSDLVDIASFQSCFQGSLTSNGCFRHDLDESGAIMFNDYTAFELLVTGPA